MLQTIRHVSKRVKCNKRSFLTTGGRGPDNAPEARSRTEEAMTSDDDKTRTPRMSRRNLLQGLAALASSGWLPHAWAQSASSATVSPAQFSATSLACTGYTFDDPRVPTAMLRAL